MPLKPRCLATAIGSMPHPEPARALDVIFCAIPDAPVWPQLSARGLHEQMEVQFSEGIPRRVIDPEKRRMYFDTSGDYSEQFAEFYTAYLAATDEQGGGDFSFMAISPDYSAGVYALEQRLQAEGARRPFVKVQTTGPCSFALSVVDENKRSLYYNPEFRDVIVKSLAMKCRWQIRKFQPYAEQVICFVDEPVLSAYGSSTYVSVQRADVVSILEEMVQAIRAEGAIPGVHCCGNTEWSILIDAGAEIVNFDAFDFGHTIAMYPEHVKRHLEQGGALAWGMVPTSAAVREETGQSLLTRYERLADQLAHKTGVALELVREQTIVTPSCGTGSLAPPDAEKVFELTGQLSETMKQRYGF